ncbi:diguanylate cyclase [Sulfurimonas sp. SAG-AH-194-I05]|nr:diguanylate cyclase [Sulfurimonas sp. SAG-AH-194-I05]MDF1874252.1 diguanylate cyclase [Sulfurimonas sp. SAG-AH-194-I05]
MTTSNFSLLYIEDDPELLENISSLLEKFVNKVYTAKDGEEALNTYHKYNPDIVISDINIPKINGLEVLSRIRKVDTDIPLVIMSAYNDKEQLEKALEVGVDSYLTKPFTLNELKKVMFKVIETRTHLEKKYEQTQKLSVINNNVIIMNTDSLSVITEVSDAFVQISGYSREELLGSFASIIRSKNTRDDIYKNLWETITSGNIWTGEIQNRAKNGDLYWVELSITPSYNSHHTIKGFTSIQTDVTEKKKIEITANRDALTLLYNRNLFDTITTKSKNTAQRYDTHLSYLMIDIDYFKEYNDAYGHKSGDDALILVAKQLLENTSRIEDYAFRIGGEEFTIIVLGLDPTKSLLYANKVREDILNLNILHQNNKAHKNLSISIGLYVAKGDDVKSIDEMYTLADKALYASKNNGRNRVTVV